MAYSQGFERWLVFEHFEFFVGWLSEEMAERGRKEFEDYWCLHPDRYHLVRQPGRKRLIPVPRWQQAYVKDYLYTGTVNESLPLPALLRPYLTYAQREIDSRLNGVLVNWYDAALGHYIGPHHDSGVGLVKGSPIVTISLGGDRSFRLLLKGNRSRNVTASHGNVFVMPWDTNRNVKHSVPGPKLGDRGRRVSITLRAFM
jgi:alkylated DNA repair dioxygenase AlkB